MLTFGPPTYYPTDRIPMSVAVGDFNHDGNLDLVTANSAGDVSVLLGNGDGTFQPKQDLPSDPYTAPLVATGDFNGDGNLDLVVTGYNDVGVLLGNGDGTFQPVAFYPVAPTPQGLVVADLNGDGNLDLAMSTGLNLVSILLGNGDGTFQPEQDYQVGLSPRSIAAGDFNGDGNSDLVIVYPQSGTIGVLLGNGDGSFQAPVNQVVGLEPYDIVVGDFNGDGSADLAVAKRSNNNVGVLLGNGDGTFRDPINFSVGGQYPVALAVGDFDGDGKLDLVTANFNSYDGSVLLGNGDGTFRNSLTYGIRGRPAAVAVGDFNGDGLPDLVFTASDSVAVLLNLDVPDQPLAATGTTFTAATGVEFAATVASFTDSDPNPGPPWSYAAQINWGDGGPSSSGGISPSDGGNFLVVGSHRYAAPGTYTVTVTITDEDTSHDTGGSKAVASSTVDVSDAAKTVADRTPRVPSLIGNFPSSSLAFAEADLAWLDSQQTEEPLSTGRCDPRTRRPENPYRLCGL